MRLRVQGRRHAFTDELRLGLKVRIEGPVRQPGLAHDGRKAGRRDAVRPKTGGGDLHDPAT